MTHEREARLQAWQRDGIFVVPQLLEVEHVTALVEACDHVLSQVRADSANTGHTTTHITGLLAPEFYAERPDLLTRLINFASSPEVLALVQDLGRPNEGALNLRSVHYFHEPSARSYDGEWHRDGDAVQLPLVDDTNVPGPTSTSLRFRVALAHDDHLELVVGSHRRADTADELSLRRGRVRNAATMAGVTRFELAPGDVCVFNTWAIHRGRYRQGSKRRTLDLVFGFGLRKTAYYESLRRFREPSRRRT